jgi:hypothetical protein
MLVTVCEHPPPASLRSSWEPNRHLSLKLANFPRNLGCEYWSNLWYRKVRLRRWQPCQARQVSGPAYLSGRLNFTSALLLEKLRHSSQMIYSIFHTSSHVFNLSKRKSLPTVHSHRIHARSSPHTASFYIIPNTKKCARPSRAGGDHSSVVPTAIHSDQSRLYWSIQLYIWETGL